MCMARIGADSSGPGDFVVHGFRVATYNSSPFRSKATRSSTPARHQGILRPPGSDRSMHSPWVTSTPPSPTGLSPRSCISEQSSRHPRLGEQSTLNCLCAPGYSFVEKARPREGLNAVNLRTNHGGVCLFHVVTLGSREVQLPTYKTLEVLAVYISGAQRNVLVVVIYRPGSQDASTEFHREFSDILERTATFSCPVIILGDLNLSIWMKLAANTPLPSSRLWSILV